MAKWHKTRKLEISKFQMKCLMDRRAAVSNCRLLNGKQTDPKPSRAGEGD
jgi:hypothetical protein